jgi:hypothetical protein
MKTKYTILKPSAIGTIAATLLAVSAQASAVDENYPIWAGHFKEAYSSMSPQTGTSMFRSNTSSVRDRLIWAGHFEQAYSGSSQGAQVVTRPGPGRYLLWAEQFPQAYQPAGEEVEATGIQVAMDRE